MHRAIQDCRIPLVHADQSGVLVISSCMTEFTDLRLTAEEKQWLQKTCPYLTSNYLSYLSEYRFKPEQIHVTYLPITEDDMFGNVEIMASGPWVETIMWEVPLMACLSESYFQSVITDWSYDGQEGQFPPYGVTYDLKCDFS